jgi:hypothetical protein
LVRRLGGPEGSSAQFRKRIMYSSCQKLKQNFSVLKSVD